MIDPLFGSIPDTRPNTTVKTDYKERPGKREVCGSSFATNVSTERQQPSGTNPSKIGTAFEKPCLYCQQFHTLATCNKIKTQPNQERMEFLKSKGLCFGCLNYSHLSKFCKRRLECKECALKHPDILHTVKKDISVSPKKNDGAQGKTRKEAQRRFCLISEGLWSSRRPSVMCSGFYHAGVL